MVPPEMRFSTTPVVLRTMSWEERRAELVGHLHLDGVRPARVAGLMVDQQRFRKPQSSKQRLSRDIREELEAPTRIIHEREPQSITFGSVADSVPTTKLFAAVSSSVEPLELMLAGASLTFVRLTTRVFCVEPPWLSFDVTASENVLLRFRSRASSSC